MSETNQTPSTSGQPQEKLKQSVSFVFFVYNEEELLEAAVRRALTALERDFEDFEVVLLDDGSKDRTGEIMQRLASEDPRIRFVPNIINMNVGIAIQRGIAAATKEFAVYDGVDLPLAPEDTRMLVEAMHDCDVLLLDRKTFAGYTRWRWITSNVNRILLRVMFGCSWRDMNYSQMFRTSIVKQIQPVGKSPAFTAPEYILRAMRLGLRVKSIPTDYHARPVGTGSLGRPHDILWSMYDMFRFRFTMWGKLKKK